MQSDLRMCRNSEPHPPSCFCTHGLFPMFNIAMAASCGPQGSHFCTSQLLEGGVGIMFAFPSLCSFFIPVLNNIAAELLAREGACDTQLLQD